MLSNDKTRPTSISPDLTITGDMFSAGDINLEGRIDGSIQCRTLTLNGTPAVNGEVKAETVRVCGSFGGQIDASKVHLTKTARMAGDIAYRTLQIDEGASFEGKLVRRKAT